MAETHRKRKRYFKVHLLDEELALLSAKADEAEMTKSDYIRNMILFGAAHERTNFTKKDSERLIYEINRIGNNVNQIAFRANSKREKENDFQAMYATYIELLSAYDDFIRGRNNGDY